MIPIRANGHTFETAIAGEGERLALLLHGFPEHAISWRHQIPLLAGLGYRVWAPNLRGYGNSFRPPNVEDYALDRLLEDVAGLIDASGARSVTLIGHDFGAILAWFFAMRRLRPLERLVTMNGPHPIPFRRELAGRAQRQRSWYVGFFALPVLPEALLGVDGARLVGELFVRSGCDPARFPPEVLERYRNEAARPGALRAMVNWYRAVVRNGTLAFDEAQAQPIEVPTLLVWGENDAALTVETTLGTERYVRDLTVRYLPGVSHFVQQDAPECVNSMLAAFLQGSAVPSAAELATASPATLEPRIPFAPSARSAPAATRIGELLGDERCELTIALRPRRSPQEAAARLA
ncbi:MAG: alpha/beta fold hydrolase, partial [Vulcanimicrobiaceae bacterium]